MFWVGFFSLAVESLAEDEILAENPVDAEVEVREKICCIIFRHWTTDERQRRVWARQ
jgi:hypothetical protein